MVSSYIAWYLFLAGVGGGAFLVGTSIDLTLRFGGGEWFERTSAITDVGLFVGPVLVGVSAFFLFLDLGAPEQAFRLFISPSGSLISWGSWAITLFCVCASAALFSGFAAHNNTWRMMEFVFSIAATVLAAFVVLYAGIFLSLYSSVPFLHTPFIPCLFVVSALATGVALLILIGFFRSTRTDILEGINCLTKFDIALIVVEIAIVVALIVYSLAHNDLSAQSAMLLFDSNNMLFWLGVVMCGLIIPLLADFVCLKKSSLILFGISAACALIGGLCLRFALLTVAQRFDLVTMCALAFYL